MIWGAIRGIGGPLGILGGLESTAVGRLLGGYAKTPFTIFESRQGSPHGVCVCVLRSHAAMAFYFQFTREAGVSFGSVLRG